MPGIAGLAVVTSSFANLLVTITTQRETGILRRRRSTPIPAWVLITAQTLTTLLVALAGVAVGYAPSEREFEYCQRFLVTLALRIWRA